MGITERVTVREGITSDHSYEVTERTIYGTTYMFIRHHNVRVPDVRGIQVMIKPDHALKFGERPTEVLSVGCRIPQRRGY